MCLPDETLATDSSHWKINIRVKEQADKARAALRSGSHRHQPAFQAKACLLSPEKIFKTSKAFQTQVAAIRLGQEVPTKLEEMPFKLQVSGSPGGLPELQNG